MHILLRGRPDAAPEDRLRADPVRVRHHAFPQPRGRARSIWRPCTRCSRGGRSSPARCPARSCCCWRWSRTSRWRSSSSPTARRCGCRPGSWSRSALGLLIPFLLFPAHRQHAHRPRVLRRRGQLPLRAGAPVAGERHPAEHAAAAGVAARLHRHALLAAALSALPRGRSRCCCSSPLPFRSRRSAASWSSGRAVALSIENPQMLAQVKELTQLAQRRRRAMRWRTTGCSVRLGFAGVLLLVAALHRLALLRAEHAAEDGHQVHGRADRAGAARADAARDQPHAQHPARRRVRRPRALLHLPGAHRRGRRAR